MYELSRVRLYSIGPAGARYADTVRAEMMTRAGIEFAIAMMREQVFRRTENASDPWFTVDYLNGARKHISFAANLAKNGIDDDGNGDVDNDEESNMPFTRALGNSAGLNSDRFTVMVATPRSLATSA